MDVQALPETTETGRAEPLVLDEAEYRVGAFVPLTRTGAAWPLAKSSLELPVFRDAADRLRGRGLADDEPWAQDTFPGTLCPQGAWRTFIDHTQRFPGSAPRVTITHDGGATTELRIIVAVGLPGGNTDATLTTERLVVPPDAGEQPLPISITWQPLAALCDDVIAEVAETPSGTCTVHHGPNLDSVETVRIVDGEGVGDVVGGLLGRHKAMRIDAMRLRRLLSNVVVRSIKEDS